MIKVGNTRRNPLARALVPGGISPADLFRDGTIGVYYDPSDFSTLYQDAAGTMPVTALEQSVGLVLDKSRGLALGVEKVSNGDFSSDSWWSKDVGVSIAGGACVFTGVTSSRGVYRNALLSPRARYEVRYTISAVNSGSVSIFVGGNSAAARSAAGTYVEQISCGSTTLFGVFASPAFDGSIDNISVREIAGLHAYQSTDAARPTLKGAPNYVNFDGLDDHLLIAAGGGGTAGFFLSVGIVAPTAGTVRTILSDRGTNTGYKVWLAADNTINFSAGNGTAHTTITSAALTPASKYIIQAWHDGANLNLSINGAAVTPVAFATATAGSSSMTLGKSNTASSEYWSGRMYAPVYTRNKAPSTQQRQGVYQWLLGKMGGLA